MRIIFFILFTFLLAQPVLSQEPTKKEMQAQMLEEENDLKSQIADLEKQIVIAKKENPGEVEDLQKELKQLKQQLALLQSVNKGISGMSDKTFQQANDEGKNDIPKKDVARINALPKKILNDDELYLFIKKANADVEKNIYDSSKTNGIRLYNEAKSNLESPNSTSLYASTCWMAGYPEIALYLMGKACIDKPADPDNLNNYASFLTMKGGEHYALPILENLNNKYHFNSTILNNIGQAWFGLGEINKASLYLDSAKMIYPYHSKANETKSVIQKSQGQTQQAIESLKTSMEEAYSNDKKEKMIELGDKDVCTNLPVKYPRSVEALGLEKFIALIPQYPMSTTDFELDNEWRDFKESINVEEEKLATQIIALKVNAEAYTAKVLIQKNQKAFLNPLNNPVYQTAQCKLFALAEWQHDRMIRFGQKLEHSIDTVDKMKDAYRKSIEGISCPSTQATAFMVAANTIWHDVQTEWVKFQKLINTEFISHYMFAALDPSLFELEKAEIKRGFLALLGGLYYEFEPVCTNAQQNNVHQSKVLPDFDELNCKYKDDIWIPGWRFTIECNKMTTECDLVIIKGKQVENLNTNEIIEGSVEFGVFKTLGAKHMGPVTAEIKAELGAFIEYDNSGIADIGIAGGVKAEIGFTNPHQLEEMLEVHTKKLGPIAIGTTPSVIVAGAEVKVGWNTSHGHLHSAVHGTGIFGGGAHGGH